MDCIIFSNNKITLPVSSSWWLILFLCRSAIYTLYVVDENIVVTGDDDGRIKVESSLVQNHWWFIVHWLPPTTKLGQGYIFTGVCDSVHRGRGMHGCRGVCMVAGGCAWLPGACMVAGGCGCGGGMHGCQGGGHAWLQGEHALLGGHAWLPGGVHGCGGHVWLLGACVVAGGMCGHQGSMHGIRRDTVNERAIRILLKCILIYSILASLIRHKQTRMLDKIYSKEFGSYSSDSAEYTCQVEINLYPFFPVLHNL